MLVVMRGLPGSGKTSLANGVCAMAPGACHCSADQYFVESAESGYKFDRDLIGEVISPLSLKKQTNQPTHILQTARATHA